MRTLVVVSYFDGRPSDELLQLLGQLQRDPRRRDFHVLVTVNSVRGARSEQFDLPGVTDIIVRENQGFNMGAWQAAWLARPDYESYVFLQDDCVIAEDGWLEAFQTALQPAGTGWVGEAFIRHRGWRTIDEQWRQVHLDFDIMATALGVPIHYSPSHLQTVAIAASRRTLVRTGGFAIGDSKSEAVAAEILTSVRARHHGLRNRQVSPLPYRFIRHPQWEEFRQVQRLPRNRLGQLARHYLPAWST